MDILDLLPLVGSCRGMPSGGVPWGGFESYRPSGPHPALTHTVHDSGPVGGKPPPLAVPTVQNFHIIGGVEQEKTSHSDVHQG